MGVQVFVNGVNEHATNGLGTALAQAGLIDTGTGSIGI